MPPIAGTKDANIAAFRGFEKNAYVRTISPKLCIPYAKKIIHMIILFECSKTCPYVIIKTQKVPIKDYTTA